MYLLDIANANFEKDHFTAERHINVACPLHLHYAMEIVCVTDGTVRMTVGEDTREIRTNECTLILPFEPHSFETPQKSNCFVLVFSPELTADAYERVRDKAAKKPVCALPAEILFICDKMLPFGNEPIDSVSIRSVLYPLLKSILDACDFAPSERKYDKALILDAVRHISRHFLSGDVSLSATATALGVHRVYLSRTFHESCGIPFTKYVNTMRASYAARLLREKPERPVSEVAYDAGFGSIRNFNREFKALYGITPAEFLAATER